MQNLILIHNNTIVYAITSLINLTLGSFFVCSHVYEKWLKQFNYSLMEVNALIKGIIVLLGFSIILPSSLFKGDLFLQAISVILGCIVGYIFFKFEILTIKIFPYQQRMNLGEQSNVKKTTANNIRNAFKNKVDIVLSKKNEYSYWATGFVGMTEELLFRGFLTVLSLNLSDFNLSLICLFLVNCIFALSHINLGYLHIATKFILGSICLISFLILENIVISMVIHATFNLLAVKKLRELRYV